jgi:Predicted dehydrogenases and related proteins
MSKLKIGIIGTGGISHCHMSGYKRLTNKVDVTAVCDIDEEKVKKYAEQYNVPRWYTDYNEMLAKETLNAVSVTTWNAEHKGATVAALKAGADVICEKPMAMNQFEAKEMYDTAEAEKKLLQIGFVRRFGNDADLLKKFIDAGSMGDLYYAKATYLRRNGFPGGWFGDKSYSGGGPLIDLGVHVMDLVRYLAGSPKPISAYGVTYATLGPNRAAGAQTNFGYSAERKGKFVYDVEDFASAMIKFDSGLTLAIEASFNLNIKNDMGNIELFGTKGGAKIDPSVEFYTDMNGEFVNVNISGNSSLSFDGLFEREIAHFVSCVADKTECRAPAKDGVILMQMIDAIYESARTGETVKI